MLSLEELKLQMAELEKSSFTNFTDDELREKINRVYDGFGEQTPQLAPGSSLCRAVKVNERPSNQARIGYKPASLVDRMGRLNRVGESIFYCAPHPFTGIFECRPQPGDIFAVSAWVVAKTLTLGHLGLSSGAAQQARITPLAIHPNESDRNRLIREWQGRVFTQYVGEGQEQLYRLPIILKEMSLRAHGDATLSGILYPSIALDMMADNVALTPSAVNEHLQLFEVVLHKVRTLAENDLSEGTVQHRMTFDILDVARANPEGTLVWGQRSQTLARNTKPFSESKANPRPVPRFLVLPPDYANLRDWGRERTLSVANIRTGPHWRVQSY